MPVTRLLRAVFVLAALWASTIGAVRAQSIAAPDKTRDNLMVVVRESIGADKQDEVLMPTGKAKAKLPDGREVEIDLASWEFIGDTHIRFVFDGPQTTIGASPADLARLDVADVDRALSLAVANVRRVYGAPSAIPWMGTIMQVQGKSPDLDSSYFLDRAYWRGVLERNPEGLVVAVPKRGGLLYVSVSDTKAVETLERSVSQWHATSGRLRVSSALYLFKDDRWSVYRAAGAAR